jgi:hypothetical protein
MEMPGDDGYGMDPTFVVGSPQYAGQLSMDKFYRTNELLNSSSISSRSMSMRRIPFAFFPHQVSTVSPIMSELCPSERFIDIVSAVGQRWPESRFCNS